MKAELKALVTAIAFIAVAFFVIAEDADAADDTKVVIDGDPVSLTEFNTDTVVDELTGKEVLIFQVAAKTIVTNSTDTSKFILNNSSANVIGGEYVNKGYTATSIDIVNHDGEDRYTQAYYSEDGSKLYWMFEVKITFSASGNPGYFVYKDILSEISIKSTNVEFDNNDHTVSDALPGYNVTGNFTARKYVNTYSDEVTIMIGQVEFKAAIDWKITPRSITKVNEDDVTIPQVPLDVVDNKDKSKISIKIYDDEIKYNLKSKDYKFTVDWDNCKVTIKGNSPKNQPVNIGNNGNYTDQITIGFDIAPTNFEGIAHVNVIKTSGYLSSDMFTNDNTFIYPYNGNAYSYEEGEDGTMKLVQNDNYFPPVKRSDCMIVVKDANGQIVIDEVAGKTSGTTPSEWNYIEMYGSHGYIGIATGFFFVELSSVSYEIGSEIIEDGIVYTVTSLDNKTVSVTGYETGIQAGVAIPDVVDGFKVTKIGTKAFYGCKTITSVDFGENIVSVGVKAFANCTKLSAVVFDDALKTISAYAFYNCGKLTDVDFPDNLKTIGSYAFYKCNALKSISFDSALKTVGTKPFTVTFEDASGKTLKQTAKVLAGKAFEGSNGVLKLVA